MNVSRRTRNAEIAMLLEEIADLLEIDGEDSFRVNAYRAAARRIESWREPIELLHAEGRLRDVPGVGPALGQKIAEYLSTGRLAYVERLRSRRLAFVPNDPLAPKQWWLAVDRAFDTWPDAVPTLGTVKVGIVDSGIDVGHPEFEGRIAAQRSFVGGDVTDEEGHGTFVAGEIGRASCRERV